MCKRKKEIKECICVFAFIHIHICMYICVFVYERERVWEHMGGSGDGVSLEGCTENDNSGCFWGQLGSRKLTIYSFIWILNQINILPIQNALQCITLIIKINWEA